MEKVSWAIPIAERRPFDVKRFMEGMRESSDFKEKYYAGPKECAGPVAEFAMREAERILQDDVLPAFMRSVSEIESLIAGGVDDTLVKGGVELPDLYESERYYFVDKALLAKIIYMKLLPLWDEIKKDKTCVFTVEYFSFESLRPDVYKIVWCLDKRCR